MATAATVLTLSTELAPVIIPIIKSLISHVTNHVSDPTIVASTVHAAVQPVVQTLSTAGVLPSGIDPNILSGAIQALVSEMSAPIGQPAPDVIANADPGTVIVPAGPPETTTPPVQLVPPLVPGVAYVFKLNGTLTL